MDIGVLGGGGLWVVFRKAPASVCGVCVLGWYRIRSLPAVQFRARSPHVPLVPKPKTVLGHLFRAGSRQRERMGTGNSVTERAAD